MTVGRVPQQLLALLRGDTSVSSAHEPDLLEAVDRHGLLCHFAGRLPAAADNAWHGRLRAQHAHALAITSELLAVHQLFADADIPLIALKGPALAMQLYGAPTARVFRDLDLLVPAQAFDRAHAVLCRHGYTPEFVLHGRAAAGLRRQYHDFGFTAPGGELIELHWTLAQARYAVPFDLDRIWRETGQVNVFDREIRVLGQEDQLLFLALHGAKHQWRQLDMVLDVATLLRSSDIDLERVSARAAAWSIRRVFDLALLLAALIEPELARATPDRVALRLAARVARSWEQHQPAGTWPALLFDLSVRERSIVRLRLGWNSLVTPGLHDWQFVRLPELLFPLYYLVRPFRLAGRALQQARQLLQQHASHLR